MFYYVQGILETASENMAVIDCNGVGYALTVSTITFSKIVAKTGQTVKLYTYLAVRDDGIDLFGFETVSEKEMFNLLTSVSGVGPKAAISILSILTPDSLCAAIAEENVKAISKANGIGAKTAARIVLDLKDKVPQISTNNSSGMAVSQSSEKVSFSENHKEAAEALYALGYDKSTVSAVLKEFPVNMPSVEMIRAALKKIASR